MKTRKIAFAIVVLLLAGVLCAAFPSGEDQPVKPALVDQPAPAYVQAYPPPFEAAYPPPVDPQPTATETIKDPGERTPDDPTPQPTRMFIGLPLEWPVPSETQLAEN